MKLLTFIWMMVFMLGCVTAQSGQCQTETMHACVGRNQFRECERNSTGDLVPTGPTYTCDMFNDQGKDLVCYGAAAKIEDICGPPPQPCRREGRFPVQGRCHNFYVCVQKGNNFIQYISECSPYYEFGPGRRQCVPMQGAFCRNAPRSATNVEEDYVDDTSITQSSEPSSSDYSNQNYYNYNNQNQNSQYPYQNHNNPYQRPQRPIPTSLQQGGFFETNSNVPNVIHNNQYPYPNPQRPVPISSQPGGILEAIPNNINCIGHKVADPTSCFHFYDCSYSIRNNRHTPNRLICPFGWMFAEDRRECVRYTTCGNRPSVLPIIPGQQGNQPFNNFNQGPFGTPQNFKK